MHDFEDHIIRYMTTMNVKYVAVMIVMDSMDCDVRYCQAAAVNAKNSTHFASSENKRLVYILYNITRVSWQKSLIQLINSRVFYINS